MDKQRVANVLIEQAWAQDAAGTATAGGGVLALVFSYLPLALIFAIFWALIIRPQSQAAKAQKELLAGLKVGDKVQTIGGLIGEIAQVSDEQVRLTLVAGVTVTLLKSAVAQRAEPGVAIGKVGPVVDVPVASGVRKGKK